MSAHGCELRQTPNPKVHALYELCHVQHAVAVRVLALEERLQRLGVVQSRIGSRLEELWQVDRTRAVCIYVTEESTYLRLEIASTQHPLFPHGGALLRLDQLKHALHPHFSRLHTAVHMHVDVIEDSTARMSTWARNASASRRAAS